MSFSDFIQIRDQNVFETSALDLFKYQYSHNLVYQEYCDLIRCTPSNVSQLEHIPFLPISFFKTHRVSTTSKTPEKIFRSSTTTGQTPSQHYIFSLADYCKSFREGFRHFYGPITDYTILAVLPSYLERDDASLVFMANDLIRQSQQSLSGFYLNEWERLAETLLTLESNKQKTLLLGVSFALLSLVEKKQFVLNHTLVMETGGMKGRRKEMVRSELHELLGEGFGVENIHSEYGMTELLSQAYSKKNGRFKCPPWMRVYGRAIDDPLQKVNFGTIGALNIIDLANRFSCAFIATEDIGRCHSDGSFEVLGRLDQAEIRGCNLLAL